MFGQLFITILFLTKFSSSSLSSSTINNNQIIKLIIKSYVNDLLDNPMINETQLKERLSRINEYIQNHPALHQQYFWVGSSPPPSNYNPDYHILEYETNDNQLSKFTNHHNNNTFSNHQRMQAPVLKVKRKKNSDKREQLPSEEICETKEKWEQIVDTHDLFDNKVKVIQEKDMQQFVFTYRCANKHGKCLGISPLFESECTERFGWMYMYYRPVDNDNNNNNGNGNNAQWGFVNAPHHCACKLRPKLFNHNHQNNQNHNINHHKHQMSSTSKLLTANNQEKIILPNEV